MAFRAALAAKFAGNRRALLPASRITLDAGDGARRAGWAAASRAFPFSLMPHVAGGGKLWIVGPPGRLAAR